MILAHLILNSAIIFGAALPAADPSLTKVRTEMLVTTGWLARHLKDPNVVVLCIAGSEGFYTEGHIPRAHLIKLADITTKHGDTPNALPDVKHLETIFRAAGVTSKSRVIIYGDSYNLLAARAFYTLDYLDLGAHAALLDGGIDKWKNELRPLTKELVKASPTSEADFIPHINQRILMDTGNIKDWTASQQATRPILLDARPLEEYTGERHSQDVHKLGHIPGAQHLYWQDLLVSRENPVLLPPDQLRKKFDAAGATPGKSVITYCRTGMQSSFDYFVAKYLGYDVRMYGPSFFEWSNEDLPAEVSK